MTTGKAMELQPCPFCGEAEHLYPAYRLDKSGKCVEPPYAIDCLGCGHDFTPRDGNDARAAWNRRAPDPRSASLAEEVERLREALRPFALAASPGDGEGDFDVPNRHPVRLNLDRSTAIDNGDLRRARALLSESKNV